MRFDIILTIIGFGFLAGTLLHPFMIVGSVVSFVVALYDNMKRPELENNPGAKANI
jgi:hypoxanthine phosphoribosyltransferase